MIGFLLGILKNLMFIGYAIVESFVFMLVFNFLIPVINTDIIEISIIHITYFQSLALFILIHFVGRFIGQLSPFKLTMNNEISN